MYVENKGKGVNISLQVLDAIMCHNGEIVESNYSPVLKTKEQFLKEYNNSYKEKEANLKMRPMTLEGCVVRISDVIGYIGRDIEDAIRVGVIKKQELPEEIIEVLGNNNSDIINTMVLDIIENSYGKPYIKMSPKIYISLDKLKKFNYEHIYSKANTKEQLDLYEKQFRFLFEIYLKQIKEKEDEKIFKVFLNEMDEEYIKNTTDERKVIDYIAGMTDDYFINEYNRLKNKER